jgi:tetratricopeptide (TPR) repeat protein
LQDFKGALADFNKAIAINPQNIYAYLSRGELRREQLQDLQGAFADFSKVIALDSTVAIAYVSRAKVTIDVSPKNIPAIVKDLRIAAKLYRQQGKTKELNMVLKTIRALGEKE